MPTPSEGRIGPNALAAALRRFPDHAAEIRRLVETSEDFREMCEDLALAEEVLAATDHVGPALREERRTEYEDLIGALAKEIQDALGEVKIIPIFRMPKR